METRIQLKRGIAANRTADTSVAIRLRYIGTGTVTSVKVTPATNIVMITSDGGTDTYAFDTYDTVGKLVDAINGDGIFEAIVLDTVRSFATAGQFMDTSSEGITAGTIREGKSDWTTWDVKLDTSASKYVAYRLTASRAFGKEALKKHRRVRLQEIEYYATLGAAAADGVRVYEVDGSVGEQKILSYTSVSATATTINFAGGNGSYTAEEGNDLVVVLIDGTSVDDSALALQVTGEIE